MALDNGKRLLDAGKGVWNEPGTLSLVSRIMGTLLTPLMQETNELRKQELQDAKDLASDLSVESLNYLYQLQGMGGAQAFRLAQGLAPDRSGESQPERGPLAPIDEGSVAAALDGSRGPQEHTWPANGDQP